MENDSQEKQNQEQPGQAKQIDNQLPKILENPLNKFCRENKDVLNVGSRIGIYVALMIIIFLATKIAVMQQVTWAEERCSCMDWGGDVVTLKTQDKVTNITSSSFGFMNPGVSDGGSVTGK